MLDALLHKTTQNTLLQEIIGAYSENDMWHVLYLCSDEKVCHELETFRSDHCELFAFPIYDDITYLGTHLFVNVYDDAGIDKYFSIYALDDHEMHPVISNQFGYVYTNDISVINQTLYLNVEDCSAITYLHFDGTTYREYGLLELSEEQ